MPARSIRCVCSFVCFDFVRLKRKGAGTGRKQAKKAAKDPNKPKRPPSAFFVFMYALLLNIVPILCFFLIAIVFRSVK